MNRDVVPSLPAAGSLIHVVGIAGVGMNPIAQVLQAVGYRVSGSDRLKDQQGMAIVLEVLQEQGITLHPQDGSGVTPDTAALVVSTAIEPDNPDLQAAPQRQIPVLHRAEALAAAIGGNRCIAIAGTSGKTTVTGMVGWILEQVGQDPFVVNGGAILNWRTCERVGNVRVGSGCWIVEVDESDRSLLRFRPDWAVITNMSRDHFPLDETISLFHEFAQQVQSGVVCGGGVADALTSRPGIASSLVEVDEGVGVPPSFSLPGRHNRENAQAAVTLCEQLGVSREVAWEALARFAGIERRLECVGVAGAVTVYDDYAHNPAKINAAWTATAEKAQRVFGIWRPHGYGPLAAMADDLVTTFREVCREKDHLYLLPVYYAGGTASKTVTSDMLAERLREAGVRVELVSEYDELEHKLLREIASHDTILCMGARDPELPVFARRMVDRLRES